MAGSLEVRSLDRSPSASMNDATFKSQATDNAEGATVDAEGMGIHELESFLIETRDEPRWRKNADKCVDYYDNQQLDNDVLQDMKDRGIPPLIINLIQPTVNTVLGMEAKARTDCRVDFDDEQYEQVAIALNKKLGDCVKKSNTNSAVSDAYGSQIKAGLGWVEVGYNPDPFGYRYRTRSVHRREIWWDWRKRDPSEWRYLIRKNWFDADQLVLAFPKMKDIIGYSMAKWGNWNFFAERLDDKTGLGQAFDIERAFTLEEQDWRDSERRRAMAFEVWYRKWMRGWVARLPSGSVIELDVEKNARHALAVAQGAVQPFQAVYPQVRQAIYIGPHRVLDRKSPLPHRDFPYIPFFGFREDLSNTPYGLIRTMISPQDEVNARRSKMLALMSARRVQMDSDAVDEQYNSVEDVAEEASRHDSVVITNPGRKNPTSRVLIEDNRDLSAQQFQVLEESKANIHDTTGVFPPMAGDNRGGLSGIAINSLVEQGTQTLAEINDNYTYAKRKVHEQQLELVKADSLHPHSVTIGEGKAKREIHLNQALFDEGQDEEPATVNDVTKAQLNVVLEDVPSTPTYRQQQLAQLTEITKSLPPELQQYMIDFVIEATDLKDRKKIAQRVRRALNIPDPGAEDQQQQDPQVAKMQQQMQESEQLHQKTIQDLGTKLTAAIQEAAQLKLANANKTGELEVKRQQADTAASTAEAKAQNERLVALATVTHDEFPKGGGADNAADVQGALEEVLAVVRSMGQEFHGRLTNIEKNTKAAPQATP